MHPFQIHSFLRFITGHKNIQHASILVYTLPQTRQIISRFYLRPIL